MIMINPLLQFFISAAFLIVMAVGSAVADQARSPTTAATAQRAPGLHRQSLALPVKRTFNLKHVDPVIYAKALGNDPHRIFEFIRDQIAYEPYEGCLRGARGTLLAMAGNSVDRAVLLANMLQAASQRVRYARGKISEANARELILSVGADRQTAGSGENRSTAKREAIAFVPDAIERDFKTVRALIPSPSSSPDGAAALDALVKEASTHYWVQWEHDGKWIDLDPSFADSTPGKTLIVSEQTLETLPEALFHEVTIRVRVEEYVTDKPSTREVLKVSVKAKDLAGQDRTLSHWPENWKGPSKDLSSAISSAIGKTGRVKPVLFAGADFIQGQSFQQKPTPSGGLPGMGAILRGEGTRKAPALATAEFVDFEFKSPNGHVEQITREIFDVIGPARRSTNADLKRSDVEGLVNGPHALDVSTALFNLYFSTGRIDASHFENLTADDTRPETENVHISDLLRNVGALFTTAADAILPRASGGGTPVMFYPDTPRVVITGFSARKGSLNIALDLRRTHVRAVALGGQAQNAFPARILRGVAEGTLERAVLRLITSGAKPNDTSSATTMSASELFERAQRTEVKPVLFASGNDVQKNAGFADDALARLRNDLAKGFLAVAPERPVDVAGTPRFAWWRVDKNTGEAVAVSDEGLYVTSVEYKATITRNSIDNTATADFVAIEDGVPMRRTLFEFNTNSREYAEFILDLRTLGTEFSYRGF
jgi:large repetitive protein